MDSEDPTTKGTSAIITSNVVNLYAKPNSSSEMISQAIIGQQVWIEEERDEWVYIRMWDGYRGWAYSRWILCREHYPTGHLVAVVTSLIADILTAPDTSSDLITKVVIMTELEAAEPEGGWVRVRLPDGREGYMPISDVMIRKAADSSCNQTPSGENLVSTAKRFIGVPYLWGGTTPFGLDCSGFVQLVYRIHGINLPRDSRMQACDERALPVERNDLKDGDLVFFAGGEDKEKVAHVGLAMGDGRFIHASGRGAGVIISSLDEVYYTEIYWGARRMFL